MLLQVGEVFLRILQTIDMINPYASDAPIFQKLKQETVDSLKHLRVLDFDGSELVDIEEPAIVNLFSRHPPITEAIRLRIEQGVEQVEGSRVAGFAFQNI